MPLTLNIYTIDIALIRCASVFRMGVSSLISMTLSTRFVAAPYSVPYRVSLLSLQSRHSLTPHVPPLQHRISNPQRPKASTPSSSLNTLQLEPQETTQTPNWRSQDCTVFCPRTPVVGLGHTPPSWPCTSTGLDCPCGREAKMHLGCLIGL